MGRDFDFVHADLYRLDSRRIGLDIELQMEEYLAPPRRAVIFAEWGERWNAPRSDCWRIDISAPDSFCSGARAFDFTAFGEEASRRLAGVYANILDFLAKRKRPC
jgi:tRNA A37 threonylcarbamoyladenosine biosynthesis protein TsaE